MKCRPMSIGKRGFLCPAQIDDMKGFYQLAFLIERVENVYRDKM